RSVRLGKESRSETRAAVVGGRAVRHYDLEYAVAARGVWAENGEPGESAAVKSDPTEEAGHAGRAGRCHADAIGVIVADRAVRHREVGRAGARLEENAVAQAGAVEVADRAVLHAQRLAGREDDPGAPAETDPLDGDAAQTDGVGGTDIDAHAGDAPRYEHPGLADPVVDDADGLGDRDGAVAAGIEHGDLAIGQRVVMRPLEGAARRQAAAVAGVVAQRRDKGASQLRLRRRNGRAERKDSRDSS